MPGFVGVFVGAGMNGQTCGMGGDRMVSAGADGHTAYAATRVYADVCGGNKTSGKPVPTGLSGWGCIAVCRLRCCGKGLQRGSIGQEGINVTKEAAVTDVRSDRLIPTAAAPVRSAPQSGFIGWV